MGRKLQEKVQASIQRTKNLRRRAAHKKKPQPDSQQPRKSKETSSPTRKETPKPKNCRQPTLSPTIDPILINQGRDQGASRTKSWPQRHTQRGKCTRGVEPGRRGKRHPTGRSKTKPTQRKCVVGQSRDRRPTGNQTGGGACPTRDRGGSMIPLGTRDFHQHARSHARSQLETIMKEQRPGGEGSRVPAKERGQ